MKALIIIAIILGVAFLFFIAKAERSLIITGNEVIPAGLTDVPKMLLDKAGEIKSGIFGNTGAGGGGEIGNIITESISTNNIITGAKDFISGTINKITETIKAPIEDKVNDILCPQK
ncbi:MAG: hypothetical protein Q7S78_01575 [Candidatus Azambacteria bacterium]|nr:hypothetical protein [Candidatus Azambacteria bacterium]